MPQPPVTDDQCFAAMEALGRHGGRKYLAARELRMHESTFTNVVRRAKERGFRLRFEVEAPKGFVPATDSPVEAQGEVAGGDTTETRRVARDGAFWRRKCAAAEKTLAEAEHIVRELQGLATIKPLPREWAIIPSAKQHAMVIGGQLSDIHAAEVINADEVGNLNAYDLPICERRLQRYFTAAATVGPRWAADGDLRGFWLALNGDLLSGTIHDELSETNACTSHEAFQWLLDRLVAGIDVLLETYPHVLVTVTPGNHSRTTQKNRFKRYGLLSYDTLIGEQLRRHYEGNSRIAFEIATGADLVVQMFRWRILQTHGNYIGTGGGKGFAGPMLPVVRGGRMIHVQQSSAHRSFDLVLTGHFHTSGQPGAHFANGSVVGYSEMANGIRATYEPPQQWLYNIHERWMLRDRAEIKLEDPLPPEKPRVRIPAHVA